jgi:hypothetical protein
MRGHGGPRDEHSASSWLFAAGAAEESRIHPLMGAALTMVVGPEIPQEGGMGPTSSKIQQGTPAGYPSCESAPKEGI